MISMKEVELPIRGKTIEKTSLTETALLVGFTDETLLEVAVELGLGNDETDFSVTYFNGEGIWVDYTP